MSLFQERKMDYIPYMPSILRIVLEPIRKIIEDKSYRIIDFYKKMRIKIIDEDEFISLDPRRESFININTPEELLQIKQREQHF